MHDASVFVQDFEFREELNDLGLIVSNCDNFIFILTGEHARGLAPAVARPLSASFC